MNIRILSVMALLTAWFAALSQPPESYFPDKAELEKVIGFQYPKAQKQLAALADSIYYYEGSDSINMEPYEKKLLWFNDYGYTTKITEYNYSSNQWIPSRNSFYTYFSGYIFRSYTAYPWNIVTEQWEDTMFCYEVNINNFPLVYFYKFWDQSQNIFTGGLRYEYSYRNDTINTMQIWYWDNDQWNKYYLLDYTFLNTPDYLEKELQTYVYDSSTETWQYRSREVSRYNSAGNRIYYLRQDWDTTIEAWVNNKLEIKDYMYDTLNTLYRLWYWDQTSYSWAIDEIDSTYYSPGLDTTIIKVYKYSSVDGMLKPYSKLFTVYHTPLDDVEEEISYSYDDQANDFVPTDRLYQVYGPYGKVLSVTQIWDETNNVWLNSYKYEYTYYSNGEYKTNTRYYWDPSIPDWVNYILKYYEYDNFDNMTLYEKYYWDTGNNNWDKTYFSISTYTTLGLLKSTIAKRKTSGVWEDDYKVFYTYKDDTLENNILYFYSFRTPPWVSKEYYYSYVTIADINSQSSPVKLYPNPAYSFIKISGLQENSCEVSIFDQNGKIVKQEITAGNKINISTLPCGTYFLQIETKQQKYLLKFVKL